MRVDVPNCTSFIENAAWRTFTRHMQMKLKGGTCKAFVFKNSKEKNRISGLSWGEFFSILYLFLFVHITSRIWALPSSAGRPPFCGISELTRNLLWQTV
jgi:hypothetical protein